MKSLVFKIFISIFLIAVIACQSKIETNNCDKKQLSENKLSDSIQVNNSLSYKEDTSDFYNQTENKENNNQDYIVGLDFPMDDETRFINSDYFDINISPEGDYKNIKNQIIAKRLLMHENYLMAKNNADKLKIIDESRIFITETLLNQIIPFWYGMQWNLAGYSDIPNEGQVGCSYFVSNTIKHGGFKLNRYKLAQLNTKDIAISLAIDSNILILDGNGDISTVKKYFIKKKKEGLYYVGLDCHVGYLLFRKNELLFIHSNYSLPLIVLAEYTEKSQVFSSNKYFISDITWNDKLILKWILNEEIMVIKS